MLFKSREFLSSLFFFGFGLFVLYQSLQFTIWSDSEPGPGFFPLLTGFLITGFSVSILIKLFISNKTLTNEIESEDESEKDNGKMNYARVFAYIILMLLYGLFLEKVGWLIITAVFLILILKYVEKQSWKRTTLLTLSGLAAIYLIFVYFLSIQLPQGLIIWL
jgi:putative tricarboxylic transport membrane protein